MVDLLTDKNQLLERNHEEIERALGGNFAAIEQRQEAMETLLLRLQRENCHIKCIPDNLFVNQFVPLPKQSQHS